MGINWFNRNKQHVPIVYIIGLTVILITTAILSWLSYLLLTNPK